MIKLAQYDDDASQYRTDSSRNLYWSKIETEDLIWFSVKLVGPIMALLVYLYIYDMLYPSSFWIFTTLLTAYWVMTGYTMYRSRPVSREAKKKRNEQLKEVFTEQYFEMHQKLTHKNKQSLRYAYVTFTDMDSVDLVKKAYEVNMWTRKRVMWNSTHKES